MSWLNKIRPSGLKTQARDRTGPNWNAVLTSVPNATTTCASARGGGSISFWTPTIERSWPPRSSRWID